MPYDFKIRAATKDEAIAAIAAEFEGIAVDASVADWSGPKGAVHALILALEDNTNLDIVAAVSGSVIFIGDVARHVAFSFEAVLSDRE